MFAALHFASLLQVVAGASGALLFSSGTTANGASGSLIIASGVAAGGASGALVLSSGPGSAGSGSMVITTGGYGALCVCVCVCACSPFCVRVSTLPFVFTRACSPFCAEGRSRCRVCVSLPCSGAMR